MREWFVASHEGSPASVLRAADRLFRDGCDGDAERGVDPREHLEGSGESSELDDLLGAHVVADGFEGCFVGGVT